MVDLDEARLTIAASHGMAGLLADAKELSDLRHACDLVVEATGVPRVASGVLDYAANGGAAVLFGVCPESARIEISPFELFRRQLSLFGTHSLNDNIPQALDTIRAIGPKIETIVTHSLAMEEIASIFADGPPPGSMKVQMRTAT